MFNYLFNQTLGNFFLDAGDDGGNGGSDTIKFGGVEIDFSADPEVVKAQVMEANKVYNASSTEGIAKAKAYKEAQAEITKLKESKGAASGGLTAAEVEAIMDKKMGAFTEIAERGKKFNLDRTIEKTRKDLRAEYSHLDETSFNEVMVNVEKTFNDQDPSYRTGNVFGNLAKVQLGAALNKNIGAVTEAKAMELIAGSPELMKKFASENAEKLGIDTNMPLLGGATNQKEFTDEMDALTTEFSNERDTNKRRIILQKIADKKAAGAAYGFKA